MSTAKAKTTDKIKLCLAELLESIPAEQITATALCEAAGVNRATFYYHFDSVQAVFVEIQTQLERELFQFLSKSAVTSDGMPDTSFYVSFFEFVQRNAAVCKMLLKTHRHSELLARAIEAGRSKVISIMTKLFPACPAAKIDYYYIFVSNGFLGLLEYWLNNGMRETVNEIAEVGQSISYMGMGYLR